MTANDRTRLRDLASKYAEYAHGEPMAERREKWRLHNGLHERTFPFHLEDNGSFHRDLTPPLECEDGVCRALEGRLLHAILSYEKIDDDRIIPDRFVVDWVTPMTATCDELQIRRASEKGYETNKPIKDLDADLHKLKKRSITLDREQTDRHRAVAEEAFDGLLPVEVGRPSSLYSNGISNKAVALMGMQELYVQMAASPEAVHRLLSFLAEDNLALGQWEEEQGLLTLNHDGNQGYCSGSSQYSDETNEAAGDQVASTDRFGYLESQESAGISPGMFAEFLMPHFSRLAEKFKLMKFGCCEAVHSFMPHLLRLNGLRKVTVTPWCNLEVLAGNCPLDVIWSRKPVPLKLCADTFDLADLRAHLQETLDIGKDHFIEFVYRDTDRLTGEMTDRVAQTCDMMRDLTGHPEGRRE